MITRQDAKNLIEKVLSYSKLPQCEVGIQWTEDDFIRYAVNGITTSGYRVTQQISITSATDDKRSGNAVVSEISDEALKQGVEQAEQLARISRPNPESMPALGPQHYPQLDNFDPFTGAARGDAMIPHIRAIIDSAKSKHLVAAGYAQRSANAAAAGNKAGLFGYSTYTDSSLTNTMRNAGGTSSGWASQSSVSLKDLSGEAVARISTDKCLGGDHKKRLDPGKYTVVLEPAAVGDLIGWLGFDLDARDAEQGQSFLSRKGGGTYLGEKLFPEHITLRSDPFERKFAVTPWSPSLLPNQKISWIEKGVVRNMYYDRFWASKAGKDPTPSAVNLVLDGQDNSLDDLIRSVDRGLLVTRLWYIRVVQPQTWQLTGLTRDGLFLIEKGKVTDPVTNFRWNESPVEVLQRTTKLGRPVRVTGGETGSQMAPPLITTDFNMASVSDAV
jgi:predicted Zn-dependent protease